MASDVTTEGYKRRLANLRPAFKPGVSGNPSGVSGGDRRLKMLAEFRAELGPLSSIDAALLDHAVASLIDSRKRSLCAADRQRALSLAHRILAGLRQRANAKADGGDLSAADLAAVDDLD